MDTDRMSHRIAFVTMHALACFYHHVWLATYTDASIASVSALLSLVAVLGALWFPHDLRALGALLVMNLVDVALWMPVVPNHWLLTAFVDAVLLLGLVATRGAPDLLARVREPVALGVGILYFYTGFWKLTTEFLNPETSCGVQGWQRLVDQFPLLPTEGVGPWLAVYGTLTLELVGPFLLVWRRTRGPAIVLFAAFHFLLGLDILQNFSNFSTVMWSLLLLMVDETAFTRLEGIGTRELLRLSRAWALVLLALQPLAALSPVVEAAGTWFSALRWLVWVLYGPFALWMFLRIAGGPVTRRPNASWAWLFPVMVVVNGLMPILGLKNRNSWQMYANLRLEADHSNHFLLPPSLDVAGYLADHVAVQQVSDPELHERWVRPGHRETWFMFRTELARHPDLSVRYERNGKVVTVERVGDHPELSQPYPLPIRAWVWFRPLGPEVGRTCMW